MCFSLPELQSISETVDIAVSRVECDAVETATRGQHTNKRCHCYRSGHITASRLKDVCCTATNVARPS